MTTTDAGSLAVPDHQTMLAAMQRASRAPSVHNTQPWHWRFDGEHLHLHADPDRLLAAADPHGRQLVISCGAALHHVRTVFGSLGWHTDTVRVPDASDPNRLAETTFRPWPDPPAGLLARADAIDRRRTDRLPMAAPEHWDAIAPRLRMLVSPHYLELDTLGESAHAQLAEASEKAAALRHQDMLYVIEIGWWTGHSGTPDGVPTDALPSSAEFAQVRVGRAFPIPRHPDAAAAHSARRADTEDHARLVVLSSSGDSVTEWLRTGEALSAVLLECTVAGLATCALTDITELPTARTALARMLPRPALPQLVIRIGTAPAGEPEHRPTPRRPLSELFTIELR
ncbi:Acg family FMN-binding oxidoreductase [Nocardia seriolae]|uniref:NAD(P)H nitroreductase acg n=1 Tax=Nocardia seriolae TaxID=37332 RepID=A0ABC8AUG2_9NOCA|nr:hypothetical protein [Nocardia seriolae]APA97779.1 Putative NAD(P)H nitroreductase acg [Nocardia seriolae]MTJ64460.1 hypothetical protein [Nocardia seriolae]MTJ73441.1 hypothetical protein [Nocardia seriolae]MTJ87546.1 hypothetical protein [Nocardia seriolae]MTK31537.1 hypothetical protein [Nocardia seriolae]